jgi:hypothetical protein
MRRQLALGLLLAPALGVAACGSENEAKQPRPASTAPGPSQSTGGAANIESAGGTGGISRGDQGGSVVQIGGGVGAPPAAVGGQSACASASAEASLLPVYLAIAFDVSGSMGKGDKPWHDRSLKWEPVVQAMSSFLEAPASQGLSASMTFFPAEGGEDERCDDESYVEPDVAMTALPSNDFGAALEAIGAEEWRGGTPTLHVLRGIISSIDEQRVQAPGKYAAVLVTDGHPQDCDDDEIADLSALVASVATELPTYVVGVANPPVDDAPDTVSALEQVAVAGGTERAYFIDTGEPEKTASSFRIAIDTIRGAAIACVVDIPPPPDGRSFDKESVSVRRQGGAAAGSLTYDPSCSVGPAWHYDDPADPRQIVLCDAACEALKAEPAARLDVEFGCERVLHIPE